MIYTDVKVPMPDKKTIFRLNKKYGINYVYYTIKAYRNEAGKPTSKVLGIGKKDEKTGLLIPNDNYYKLFGNNKTTTTEIIPTYNISSNIVTIGNVPTGKEKCPKKVMTIGTSIAFMEIAKQTKLLETLQKCFPTKWKQLLSTVFYMLSQGNVMAYIDDWFDVTKVDFVDRYSDVVCSRLFASLTEEELHLFFTEWMACRSEQEHIIYDVTSISSYSQNIDMLEFGYNRDGDNLPQINFGLFYGLTSKMPVYYQIYNGSIPDKSSFQYMMLNANDVGIQNVSVVFDKGSVTQDNISFMYENNYSFITAMSCSSADAVNLIDETYIP